VKKSLLIATVLVVGLLVVGLMVGGCASGTTTTTSLSTTTSTTFYGLITSTSTAQAGSTDTSSSDTTVAETSTTATTVKVKENRYEQNDPHIVYAGTWKTSANAAASGGTFTYTNSSKGKVTITFEGTHLSLFAKKSSKYGKAYITLDGKKLGTIDLYSVDATYQKKVWGTGQLKSGTHTVVIEWTGTKRAAASDTNINIDYVLVAGTLQ
jgi:hypothetical protein